MTALQKPRAPIAPDPRRLRIWAPDEPQPFGLVPGLTFRGSGLTFCGKVVLTAICIAAQGSRSGVRASIQEIAFHADCDVRSVRKGLRELVSAGVLAMEDLGVNFRFLFRLKGGTPGAYQAHTMRAPCAPGSGPPGPPYMEERERELDRDPVSDQPIPDPDHAGQGPPGPPPSPDPYRGARNPGRPPEGWRWSYSAGVPRHGRDTAPRLEPALRTPETPPTKVEINACLYDLRTQTAPLIRNAYLGLLRGWVDRGYVPVEMLAEFEKPPAPATVAKQSPTPEGQLPGPGNPGPRQQRARQDSNLQPSDSKAADSARPTESASPDNDAKTPERAYRALRGLKSTAEIPERADP